MTPLIQKICLLAGILCFLHFQEISAITCYNCNSQFDPRCGDTFDPYSLGTVNCSMKPPLEHLQDKYKPIICRKIKQKVYGVVRIVRGCGYIPDENSDDKNCVKRSGTHDVQALYCGCTTDLCNGALSTMMIDSNQYLTKQLPLALTIILLLYTNCNRFIRNL